jgi:hypothetical protein
MGPLEEELRGEMIRDDIGNANIPTHVLCSPLVVSRVQLSLLSVSRSAKIHDFCNCVLSSV